MITKEFVLAGRAVFTLELEESFAKKHALPKHYTYRVKAIENSSSNVPVYLISLLTGPKEYQFMGVLDPKDQKIIFTSKTKFRRRSFCYRLLKRALVHVWAGNTLPIEEAGFHLHHEGRCGKCGRLLTVPESIKTGFGPECSKRLAA